jgi:membrane protein YdbS with pleckstrin-like domain
MKLLRTLTENIKSAGIEDWLWWLIIVPVLLVAALVSHHNGTLPNYLWSVAKGVVYVLIAIPVLLLMGYCFARLTKKQK